MNVVPNAHRGLAEILAKLGGFVFGTRDSDHGDRTMTVMSIMVMQQSQKVSLSSAPSYC